MTAIGTAANGSFLTDYFTAIVIDGWLSCHTSVAAIIVIWHSANYVAFIYRFSRFTPMVAFWFNFGWRAHPRPFSPQGERESVD